MILDTYLQRWKRQFFFYPPIRGKTGTYRFAVLKIQTVNFVLVNTCLGLKVKTNEYSRTLTE